MAVNLLIADDEDNIRNGVANYVRLHSDRVDKIYLAADGGAALDCILKHRPQIMLLDIQMPDKTGIEVMKEAKEAEALPITIILSGYDEFRYAQQALRFGAREYLLKPCRSTDIMRLIETMIDEVEEPAAKEHAGRNEATDNSLVNRAVMFIQEHYHENLTLAGVAEEVEITSGYLSSLFSHNMDCGFVDYLNRVRVEHACIYLKHNRLKVYEIAFKVGYRDEKYFSKVFKKMTGVSPAEYKKQEI